MMGDMNKNSLLKTTKYMLVVNLVLIIAFLVLGVFVCMVFDTNTNMMNESPTILTAQEVATQIGVSTSTIYRWNSNGFLPRPTQIGRQMFWLESEITLWMRDVPRKITPGGSN